MRAGALLRKLAERKELLDGLFQDMLRLDPEAIKGRLTDVEPDIRLVAVNVVGKRRLHFEKQLIECLSDTSPEVQEAAHQALMRLSRRQDFGPTPPAQPSQRVNAAGRLRARSVLGPTPTAQPIQREQAIQAWENWRAVQDRPGRPSPGQAGPARAVPAPAADGAANRQGQTAPP